MAELGDSNWDLVAMVEAGIDKKTTKCRVHPHPGAARVNKEALSTRIYQVQENRKVALLNYFDRVQQSTRMTWFADICKDV